VPGYAAAVNSAGMTVLAGWLDCTEPYSGTRQRDDIFVIGLGTEAERIFTTAQRDEALAYAKSERLRLTRLTAHTVCHDAMIEVFGS
jgi:hypothetical protein